MDEDGDGAPITEVVSLLDDEYAVAILAQVSQERMSAKELAIRCGADDSTIYRRIERLRKHDLVDEEVMIDPDGYHYKRYLVKFEQVTIGLNNGEYSVEIIRTDEDPVDRFTRLFEGLS